MVLKGIKKIGRGAYYNVYDIGNNRVYKKIRSDTGLLLWHFFLVNFSINGLISLVCKRKILLSSLKKEITLQYKIASLNTALFGNPIFENDFSYTQDKAVPLSNLIHGDHKPFLQYIQEYINASMYLWSKGYHDTVFNFTLNTGVSEKTNTLIILDMNEFSDSFDNALVNINSKKWETQSSLLYFPPGELKESIKRLLNESFGEDILRRYWARNL